MMPTQATLSCLLQKPAYQAAQPKPGEDAWSLLRELRETQKALDIDGQARATTAFITDEEGMELYRAVFRIKPELAVEIGFLHGYSTLHLLQALADLGRGRLISIDPGQFGDYAQGIGLMNVRRAGLDSFHLFWNEASQFALPQLCQQGMSVDFAFVDGSHLLDYTLLEFFYLDKMLKCGGLIAFHDYVNPSVFTALQYIESNFPYAVQECAAKNLRILAKIENDSRPWYYFIPFRVPEIAWTSIENRQTVDVE